jgi:hypothetical protein
VFSDALGWRRRLLRQSAPLANHGGADGAGAKKTAGALRRAAPPDRTAYCE